jgi:D-alanyl-lipoteichoic acid acyltransferase DltB (MBOAT superfamily)
MTFTSVAFYLFLPLTLLAVRIAPPRARYAVLLVASYLFYATFRAPQLLAALALETVISYVLGRAIGAAKEGPNRTALLWCGVALCTAILVVLKYIPTIALFRPVDAWGPGLAVTVGLSYFTFQAIAYLVDIYLSTTEPEEHLGYHALALAFFPKLLQGPIERKAALYPQLHKLGSVDPELAKSGSVLFAMGLFKKLVLADCLGFYANAVFDSVRSYTGLPLLLAAYAYAFQIFFDFSGYTDMARGAARLFGIELARNFDKPYLADSVPEFWRRWHMSFSRWIMDYIFKPLQMAFRDLGAVGAAIALILTFLLSGIWHGATWGFVVWGLLHGTFLAASWLTGPLRKRRKKALGIGNSPALKAWKIFLTFNLVCLAWVFFRANSLADGWYIVTNVLDFRGNLASLGAKGVVGFVKASVLFGKGAQALLMMALSTTLARLALAEFEGYEKGEFRFRARYAPLLRGTIYALSILLVVLGANNASTQFIYSKF